MDQDDIKPWDKVKLPTDKQRARGRGIVNKAVGYDFFDNSRPVTGDDVLMAFLVLMLNKDKILGFGHDS